MSMYIFFFFIFNLFPSLYSLISSPIALTSPAKPDVSLAFLSNVDLHKKQLAEAEKNLDALKKRREQEIATRTKQNNELSLEIDKIKKQLNSEASTEAVNLLNQIITHLNARKQENTSALDTVKGIVDFGEKHIKLLKEIIEFLQTPATQEQKLVYSWKEFNDAQIRNTEFNSRIESAQDRRDELSQQNIAEKETIIYWQRQIDVKNKELEKVSSAAQAHDKDEQEAKPRSLLKLEADAIKEETLLLQAKIQNTRLVAEKVEIQIKHQESEIELLKYRRNDHNNLVNYMSKHLAIDQSDVDTAKEAYHIEFQKAQKEKDSINQLREVKKNAHQRALSEIDVLKEKRALLKAKGMHLSPEGLVLKSTIKKQRLYVSTIEQELAIIDAQKKRIDAILSIKDLLYKTIELRFRISKRESLDSLDELIANYSNPRNIALSELKNLREKSTAVTRQNSQIIDTFKSFKNKFYTDYEELIKSNESHGKEIKKNLEQALKYSEDHSKLAQKYLSIIIETIGNQEKIIAQYNNILSFLESERENHSIWERSPRAISWQEFLQSMVDAENFFRRIFWNIPVYLSPSSLISSGKDLLQQHQIALFLFLLLFLSLYFGCYVLLAFLHRKVKEFVSRAHPRHSSFFYLNIIASYLDFSLAHYRLLFTWTFLVVHIYFNFDYAFKAMSEESIAFYSAFFYLTSIPILLYLSQQLRSTFKELNKTLSYIFFAERFQDKFILLLTIFLYTTSILLPLRRAFLCYPTTSLIAAVILAGYTLAIILIIAFFFNKDDIIKLIPSGHPFLMWLKKKIERHYYPVFFFVISLFVLSNPYIGYSNLAWYLAFAVTSTALIVNALFLLHHYIRDYSVFLFMREEDDEIIDKFEHAKAYYGFLVIFSFISLLLIALVVSARIWGYNITIAELWRLLSKEWVIPVTVDSNVGIIQFFILSIFIAAGFLTSSLTNKFMLHKLFEVLRTEAGTQNTVSRIFHYVIISLAIMLGFMAIKLANFILAIGTLLFVGISLALKDIATDIIAGFIVLLERPVEIGNFIQMGDFLGTVRDISARSTTIVTARNAKISISNKEILTKTIINWGQCKFAMGLEIFVRVDHDSDPELVKQLLLTAAQNNPLVLRVPSVLVRLDDLKEDYLLFMIRPYISSRRIPEFYVISSNIRLEILALFKKHNVKLAKPQRLVHYSEVKDKKLTNDSSQEGDEGAITIKGPSL